MKTKTKTKTKMKMKTKTKKRRNKTKMKMKTKTKKRQTKKRRNNKKRQLRKKKILKKKILYKKKRKVKTKTKIKKKINYTKKNILYHKLLKGGSSTNTFKNDQMDIDIKIESKGEKTYRNKHFEVYEGTVGDNNYNIIRINNQEMEIFTSENWTQTAENNIILRLLEEIPRFDFNFRVNSFHEVTINFLSLNDIKLYYVTFKMPTEMFLIFKENPKDIKWIKKKGKKYGKKEKKKKKKEREIKRQEKEEKRKKLLDEKQKKIAENEDYLMEQVYDIINEQSTEEIENELLKEVNLNSVKIYESPLPYQRHINSLEYFNPNKSLLPAILNGSSTLEGGSLTIYHGPPGTGKTYTLIKKLSQLLKSTNIKCRFLVCAASNIGTLNLYNRAKSFKIKGSLVLSKNFNIPENEKMEWKPNSDRIIFSTISMRYGRILNDQKFNIILIDEAAQCQESWMLGLLRNEVTDIYMAGDPHQLPAVVSQEGVVLKHDRSLMTRLMELGYPATLLNIQRRMHPEIVKFPNENFYNNELKTEYKGSDININPFEIINVNGEEERIGTSYENKLEAEKVLELVKEINIPDTVIITPYQAQCKLLKKLNNNLKIHTIDSFQGREADVIILTTVRTNNMGFWSDYRRLNVALTRAKHVLRIVGNTNAWKSNNGPLSKLIN